ncbi:MAG: hypothetical protein ACRCZ0_10620 [Cetobacterium sp.]
MNKFEIFLLTLKKEMKLKKITGKKMAADLELTEITICNILNCKMGTFSNLNKIVDYIESK